MLGFLPDRNGLERAVQRGCCRDPLVFRDQFLVVAGRLADHSAAASRFPIDLGFGGLVRPLELSLPLDIRQLGGSALECDAIRVLVGRDFGLAPSRAVSAALCALASCSSPSWVTS